MNICVRAAGGILFLSAVLGGGGRAGRPKKPPRGPAPLWPKKKIEPIDRPPKKVGEVEKVGKVEEVKKRGIRPGTRPKSKIKWKNPSGQDVVCRTELP